MKMNFQNKTLQIYLVRHGESWGNKKQVVYGNSFDIYSSDGFRYPCRVSTKEFIILRSSEMSFKSELD